MDERTKILIASGIGLFAQALSAIGGNPAFAQEKPPIPVTSPSEEQKDTERDGSFNPIDVPILLPEDPHEVIPLIPHVRKVTGKGFNVRDGASTSASITFTTETGDLLAETPENDDNPSDEWMAVERIDDGSTGLAREDVLTGNTTLALSDDEKALVESIYAKETLDEIYDKQQTPTDVAGLFAGFGQMGGVHIDSAQIRELEPQILAMTGMTDPYLMVSTTDAATGKVKQERITWFDALTDARVDPVVRVAFVTALNVSIEQSTPDEKAFLGMNFYKEVTETGSFTAVPLRIDVGGDNPFSLYVVSAGQLTSADSDNPNKPKQALLTLSQLQQFIGNEIGIDAAIIAPAVGGLVYERSGFVLDHSMPADVQDLIEGIFGDTNAFSHDGKLIPYLDSKMLGSLFLDSDVSELDPVFDPEKGIMEVTIDGKPTTLTYSEKTDNGRCLYRKKMK